MGTWGIQAYENDTACDWLRNFFGDEFPNITDTNKLYSAVIAGLNCKKDWEYICRAAAEILIDFCVELRKYNCDEFYRLVDKAINKLDELSVNKDFIERWISPSKFCADLKKQKEQLIKIKNSELTIKQKKKYINKLGTQCPYCNSDNLNYHPDLSYCENGKILQTVICKDCDKQWQNLYQLKDIKEN